MVKTAELLPNLAHIMVQKGQNCIKRPREPKKVTFPYDFKH